jgi:hypothetical protein
VLVTFGTLAILSGPVEYALFFPARRREKRRALSGATPPVVGGDDELSS